MLLPIRILGDPVLREPAKPVESFDRALRQLAKDMIETMYEAPGVGLAAPQVGSLRRLAVVMTGEEEPPIALVNPEIIWRSEEVEADFEGCLSIGEISVEVPRAVAIRVRAQDVEGNPVELAPEGFFARVIQHELDHLDGVLILDRTAPEQRREALKALRDGG